MFETLNLFRMAAAMARHAGQRQAIVAQNVAHADTPGYVARDIPDFRASYLAADGPAVLRASRARHLHGQRPADALRAMAEVSDQAAPNGNQVSLETEMLKSVDAKRQHDRALAIYRSALMLLRGSLRTN